MLSECFVQLIKGERNSSDMNDLTGCKVMRATILALILLSTFHGSVRDFRALMAGTEVRAMLQAVLLEPAANISVHDPDFKESPCLPNMQSGRIGCILHTQPVGVTDDTPPLILELTRDSRDEWSCTMKSPDLRAPDACHVKP